MKNASRPVPDEIAGLYDDEKYQKSQSYLIDQSRFGIVESTFTLGVLILAKETGLIGQLDAVTKEIFSLENVILWGVLFFGLLGLASLILNLPFQIYSTFVLEEKYGFNRTTPKVFMLDLLKSALLGVLVGGPVLYAVLWLLGAMGSYGWLYAWIFVVGMQLLLSYLAPHWIMPLFNKFTRLENGELRDSIERYASSQNFELSEIYMMDGSKRSSKANAFFTGLGNRKRIVLFDTLVEKQSTAELVSVLAHEIGHFKMKHIPRQLVLGVFTTGVMFYVLSVVMGNQSLVATFGFAEASVHASLFVFAIVYSPVSQILGVLRMYFSRKYEFEADDFAVRTCNSGVTLESALRKLSQDNLSNLTPHPLKVFLEYSHPPLVDRVKAIRAINSRLSL